MIPATMSDDQAAATVSTRAHPLALVVVFLALGSPICPAAERKIHFLADGKDQESKYLWKHQSRTFVLEGWGRPIRNVDGKDGFVIWRFNVADATRARFAIEALNSFALSVSTDGGQFKELSREAASGGANEGTKSADLTPFLPAEFVYVKVAHGAPEKWGAASGPASFPSASS